MVRKDVYSLEGTPKENILTKFNCLHKPFSAFPCNDMIACFCFSAAVVLVFFVCWTPFHAQRLMFVIVTLQGSWTTTNGFAHHVLFLASGNIFFPVGTFFPGGNIFFLAVSFVNRWFLTSEATCYIILLCTHLYHTSFGYLSITCNLFVIN